MSNVQEHVNIILKTVVEVKTLSGESLGDFYIVNGSIPNISELKSISNNQTLVLNHENDTLSVDPTPRRGKVITASPSLIQYLSMDSLDND
jgi:hypothetical protein